MQISCKGDTCNYLNKTFFYIVLERHETIVGERHVTCTYKTPFVNFEKEKANSPQKAQCFGPTHHSHLVHGLAKISIRDPFIRIRRFSILHNEILCFCDRFSSFLIIQLDFTLLYDFSDVKHVK